MALKLPPSFIPREGLRPNPLAIRFYRYCWDWRQEDLARDLGVSTRTIGHWERGDYEPGPEVLDELIDWFEISKEKVLDGRLPIPPKAQRILDIMEGKRFGKRE